MIINSIKHLMKVRAIASDGLLLFRSFLREKEIAPLTSLVINWWCLFHNYLLMDATEISKKNHSEKSLMNLLNQVFKQKAVEEQRVK